MWIFLLLIILLLLLWPVIRLALGYRKLRQHMSQAYRQQQYDNDSRQGQLTDCVFVNTEAIPFAIFMDTMEIMNGGTDM